MTRPRIFALLGVGAVGAVGLVALAAASARADVPAAWRVWP